MFNRWNAMAASHNKLRTHSILALSGIPTPLTVAASRASYDDACAMLGKDVFVVKQPDSSRGSNVFLVSNKEEYDLRQPRAKAIFSFRNIYLPATVATCGCGLSATAPLPAYYAIPDPLSFLTTPVAGAPTRSMLRKRLSTLQPKLPVP